MSDHSFIIVVSYVRYVNIHILLRFQPSIPKWLSYGRKTEISNYGKGDNDVIIHDEPTFSSEVRTLWSHCL